MTGLGTPLYMGMPFFTVLTILRACWHQRDEGLTSEATSAPEMLQTRHYGAKIDCYSFAMVLWYTTVPSPLRLR
jgi:hypothetical protein